MDVTLLAVPYDSGHVNARMGKGPEHLLRAGLVAALEKDGHAVECRYVGAEGDFQAEIATGFELARRVAEEVAESRAAGRFPLVLSGNCGTALGTVAALGPETAVVWLDAHGDLNTPETTASGFLDGMALAVVLGRCWRGLASAVPGFAPVPEARVAHVGGRDLDPAEEKLLLEGRITRVTAEDLSERGARHALGSWLAGLPEAGSCYFHVDLDVLDPTVAAANAFAAAGGLGVGDVEALAAAVAGARPLGAAALTSFDPAADDDGRSVRAAADIARAVVRAAAGRP